MCRGGQHDYHSWEKLRVLLALNGYDDFFSVGNNGFCNGVQVLVSDRLYPQLTGAQDYAEFRPVLNADADRETFEQTIDNLCTRAAGTTWVSYEETDRQLAESGRRSDCLRGADSADRSDWHFKYRQHGLYQYSYAGGGDWHAAGDRHECGEPVQDISVGGRLLWHRCRGHWKRGRNAVHGSC